MHPRTSEPLTLATVGYVVSKGVSVPPGGMGSYSLPSHDGRCRTPAGLSPRLLPLHRFFTRGASSWALPSHENFEGFYDTHKRRTRKRIRTSNLLDLNQTPLPIGLYGQAGQDRGECPAPSAHERSRTSTGNDLNVVPLPLGYVRSSRPYSPRRTGTEWNDQRVGPSKSHSMIRLSTPGQIRTDAGRDLNPVPLPLGYRGMMVPPAI